MALVLLSSLFDLATDPDLARQNVAKIMAGQESEFDRPVRRKDGTIFSGSLAPPARTEPRDTGPPGPKLGLQLVSALARQRALWTSRLPTT